MKIEQSGTAIRDTTGKRIGKYASGVGDLFASGEKFRVTVKPYWVTSSDTKALRRFQNYVKAGDMLAALETTFISDQLNKKEIQFGQVCKPKVGANMGDTAEGVFAAAIACRFAMPAKRRGVNVTTTDVFSMIHALPKRKGADSVTKTYKAPNKGIGM